jgi:hypothetical protein
MHQDGNIKPIIVNGMLLNCNDLNEKMIENACKFSQQADLKSNEDYRKDHNLSHKYEYNHFITEGKVLYCLNMAGYVVDDTMYKIKPKDIEEVHWARFDEIMEKRVDEAISKCVQRESEINEMSIKEELDMGDKEWSKFGKDIKKYLISKQLLKN